METTIPLERRGEFDFAKPQFRAVLRDGRLSFGARGLFQFLWDLPEGWSPRPCHLLKMSGAGKGALGRLRRELEEVGGLVVEAIRLTAEQAQERNDADPSRSKQYRAGQVVGSKWVLFSPHLWAKAMPLNANLETWLAAVAQEEDRDAENPTVGVSDCRKHRQSGKPPQRFTHASQGSPSSTQQQGKRRERRGSGIVTFYLEDVAAAAQIESKNNKDDIASAVKRVETLGKEPVPGLVQKDLDDIAAERDRKEEEERARRETEERDEKEAAATRKADHALGIQKMKKAIGRGASA